MSYMHSSLVWRGVFEWRESRGCGCERGESRVCLRAKDKSSPTKQASDESLLFPAHWSILYFFVLNMICR